MRTTLAILLTAAILPVTEPALADDDGWDDDDRVGALQRGDDDGVRHPGGLRHGTWLGTGRDEIARNLRDRGFRIEEIERDDDEWELDAYWRGVEYEIDVSRRSGRVTEIEIDD